MIVMGQIFKRTDCGEYLNLYLKPEISILLYRYLKIISGEIIIFNLSEKYLFRRKDTNRIVRYETKFFILTIH